MVSISELNGKRVVTSDAFVLGQIEGGSIDTANWQITHIHVNLNDQSLKALNLKKPFMGSVLVCLPVNLVQTVGDVVSLKEPLNQLKDTEQCKEYT